MAQEVYNSLNKCMELETLPDDLEFVQVVALYKKGDAGDPSNYRPISLLQSLCKIYASRTQIRLASQIEENPWKTQDGFRAKRSIAEVFDRQLFSFRIVDGFASWSLMGSNSHLGIEPRARTGGEMLRCIPRQLQPCLLACMGLQIRTGSKSLITINNTPCLMVFQNPLSSYKTHQSQKSDPTDLTLTSMSDI